MPVVTQSRDLTVSSYWTAHLSGVDDSGYHLPNGGHQTTTSYRSKNRLNGKELEYNSLTGPELAERLGHEYRTQYDNGNEFFSKHIQHVYTFPRAHIYKQDGTQPVIEWYDGMINLIAPDWGYGDWSITDPTNVNVDGTRCISHVLPNAPEAALTSFLLELREQMPTLYGTTLLRNGLAAKRGNTAGQEYLNHQFGIKPLISDLQKLSFAVLHIEKLIRQWERNSDVTVRRRTTLYDTSAYIDEASVSTYPFSSGIGSFRFLQNAGQTTLSSTIRKTCWFSGAFMYHLDKGSNFLTKMKYHAQQANIALGTDFNVSTAWEIMPWSWLADWFSDSGDFLRNITYLASDNLVLRYGYVMHTFSETRNIVQRNITPKPLWFGIPETMTQQCVFTIKTRHRATPYGFGLDVEAFSPRQWAILAALGLTKDDKSLRRRVS